MNTTGTYSDQELLVALYHDSSEAFETLYNRYFERLCKHAYKKIQDEHTVEEIVQDVFVDLWKKRNTLDMEGQIANLLFAILRNKTLHELRARVILRKHMEEFSLVQVDQSADVAEHMYMQQIQEKIDLTIDSLSPQCRRAFILSRYEHLSYKQIAENMNISVNTVEKHIGKALNLLRQQFHEYNSPILILIGIVEILLDRL